MTLNLEEYLQRKEKIIYMKNICVYCSSSDNLDKSFFETAKNLGIEIAENGYGIVYGGSTVGLMWETARTVKDFGGKVIGVIPEKLCGKGVANQNCDKLFITQTMRERKQLMEEKADAFITLPGGFGTMEEIFEMITAKQLGYHNKPLVFLDVNNFYAPLFEYFENIYRFDFAKPEYRNLYYIASNPQDAINYINTYKPIEIVNKWFSPKN